MINIKTEYHFPHFFSVFFNPSVKEDPSLP